MTVLIKSPKKLIEVALPLDAINKAAAREKSIRHGHPSTLHLWWARRPLAAARAVIFAQLVNDPGYQQGGGFKYGKNKKEAAVERKRLFKILEDLVFWENTNNEAVLEAARAEIRRSWREVCDLNKDHPQAAELFNPDKMPGLHDPFAGGGTIPLEAQRLGLEALASDLNPVAVLINKAMIEIPPKFAGRPPVHPDARKAAGLRTWKGAEGLAEDVRRYGAWMREEAEKRIGHLYPKVKITPEVSKQRPDLKGLVGKDLTVIAWLWARTVKSPSPAFSHVDVPLVSTFVLSSKAGKESWIQVALEGDTYAFQVRTGKPDASAKAGTRASGKGIAFRCILSGAPISVAYVQAQAKKGALNARLMALVAQGSRKRVFLAPSTDHEKAAGVAKPSWTPDVEFFQKALGFRIGNYGMNRWADLFTKRQLAVLATFSDLVGEARGRVLQDAKVMMQAGANLASDGNGAEAYADAIGTYLAFALSKSIAGSSTGCTWMHQRDSLYHTFAKQALSMTWDFAEVNLLADCTRSLSESLTWTAESVEGLAIAGAHAGSRAEQADAGTQNLSRNRVVSTDPPYYDNIGYADLSDYFYVWLRRSQRDVFPGLFATLTTPKAAELVATPARHGGRVEAEAFFVHGMTEAMHRISGQAHPAFPVTLYYAFKQAETKDDGGTSSSGWETFLRAILAAGLAVTGTWPIRTERETRSRGLESNALASSIVLVCRSRPSDAPSISRRQFLRELNSVLPDALDEMTRGLGDDCASIAPADMSQAIIGPGMAVFSKYSAVLEADGSPMSVKTALQIINRFLAEDDFDHDTQFCLHWFEQSGWSEGPFGEADVLARAKATSVAGVTESGVVKSGSGKVRLLRPTEYSGDWTPRRDSRVPIWEALHQLIRALRAQGESGAGQLLAAAKAKSEAIRQLAYRLYTLCERRGWADDARTYNELVTSWTAIEAAASELPEPDEQLTLFGGGS